jgi:glycosyltransferase involved in cell wall biosynthesis
MAPIILDARTAIDHFPGIGRYVVNLASALKRVSPELDLSLLRDPSAPALRLALPDLPTIDCAVSPFTLSQQWRVRQALRGSRAALYHSPYYLMPYRPGVAAVFTCHDLIPLIFPQYFKAQQRLVYRFTHQLALSIAQLTIAVSQSTKNDLQRFFRVQPDRIVVVHEGVDAHFQPPARTEIDRVKQHYALPDRYVLYFGSNKPHKNLVRLLEAFAQVRTGNRGEGSRDQSLGIGLVIGGYWDQRYPEAKQSAEKLGLADRVHFIGSVRETDLPAFYGGATAFAFVSEYEGFGLPPLEAMACGTPVIASNTSSLPEVIGEAGLLVDPHDVSAIAAALDRLVSDAALRADLKKRSVDRAAAFTWERTAAQTLAVYRAIIGA